jgi:hypothetical protein
MIKNASIGIRMDPALKEALEKAAEADRRSVASYLEVLVIKDLKAKGLWPKKGSTKK